MPLPFWFAVLLFQAPPQMEIPNVQKNPLSAAADLEWGKKLYEGRCAGCHGPTGNGGKGANIGVPRLPRADDDRSLYRVIRYGIPETEMPSTFLVTKEVWQLALYVRSLGQVGVASIVGDAARGEAIARGNAGCAGCHALPKNGVVTGGNAGPPLDGIGSRRSAAFLQTKLATPQAELPEMYRTVEAVTGSGSKISGVRMNEDTWTIQIRDSASRLHSLDKDALSSLKVERRSIMPSYKDRLTGGEFNDVIAYLSSLRGNQ